MLGYICKYAPVELFEYMGAQIERMEPEVTSFNQADQRMHPNICSFTKGVLEAFTAGNYEGLILTTCCDSIRRLYDVLREEFPDRFIYLLDTPRITRDAGIALYEQRIRTMMDAYAAFCGKTFDEGGLAAFLAQKQAQFDAEGSTRIRIQKGRINIGIAGARVNAQIKRILEQEGANIAFDLTCTGLKRTILLDPQEPLRAYVRGLLSQFPCMRMEAAAGRDELIKRYADSVDGVIYHTVQFCDNYAYEYAWLKKVLQRPLLQLETDYTKQSYGQILTRIEAFLESLRQQTKLHRPKGRDNRAADGTVLAAGSGAGQQGQTADARQSTAGSAGSGATQTAAHSVDSAGFETAPGAQTTEENRMYVMGIDSGSTSTNAVIMDDRRNIKAFAVVRTGAKSGESAARILDEVLNKAGLKREDLALIVSTGYGRVSIPFADENVTEISCHGRGAHYFNPKIRTILDIGGQDSKAIHLNDKGEVTDFVMNDKCAAGTGRFLEMIARSLEIGIDELGPISLKSTERIEITSMCSVFAESEVISLIANNKEKADIAAGICRAIANKSFSLLKRVGLEPDFMMTGGVAKNPGVVHAVEEKLGAKLYICPEPEIVGAAGAALYALDRFEE